MTTEQPPPSNEQDDEFKIDYIKSNHFRVVYAEGFWGGLTAGQNIHVAFWNSREAIPKQVRYRINTNGEVEESGRTVRADQIREIEVGVLMDLDSAKALRECLDDVIAEAEEMLEGTDEEIDSRD